MWLEKFAARSANKVARRVRKALMQIPFYRQKLQDNKIPISEVRGIDSVAKLERFLNKYRGVKWVSDEDLINNDFSLKLSLVPQSERIWVQSSSGYEASSQALKFGLKGNEQFLMNFIAKKKVAFTRNDLKMVIDIVYKRGLEDLVAHFASPTIALFGTMGVMHGSGTFPLIGISGGYADIRVKTLYFGIPLNELQTLQWVSEAKSSGVCGIISNVRSLDLITDVALSKGVNFENLFFVAVGGDPVPEPLIKRCHEIGAKIVVVGYSVQEVVPLGAIARGVVSSVLKEFPVTSGLVILGNLCFVRITDKEGFSVNAGEKGIIKITAPFEGATLIDYNTHDIGRFIDIQANLLYRGRQFLAPYPILGLDIRREAEHTLRVVGNNIPTYVLYNLCYEVLNHDFLLGTDSQKLYVFLTNNTPKDIISQLKNSLRMVIPQERTDYLEVRVVSRELLRKCVYPAGHHKPHNVIIEDNILQSLVNCSKLKL